jgi:hypothetical protein
MKTTCFLTILFLFNLFSVTSFAQGEAAVPFLLLNPSPSLSAMGATGTALPTEDPFGFLWNPAQLGYTSQTNNLSFIFYPSKLEWIPAFNLDLELKGIALNAGYNFKDLIGFPLSFGFGYSNTEINFGEFIRTGEGGPEPIGTFGAKDYYNAYSFGLGIDYFVQLSVGYTIKDVTSILSDRGSEESPWGSWTGGAYDFGILMNVPVIRLINEDLLLPLDDGLNGKPTFAFSLGYSKSNMGDEVYYIDKNQADPLPRVDRTGYGFSAGFDLISKNLQLNLMTISFTSEAEDILVTRDSIGGWEYQSTWSDLNFWKNVIMIEGDENIVSRTGTKLEFVESFAYYFGHFSGRGYLDPRKTNVYEIRAKGLLKLCALWAKHPVTDFLRDHFDIRYYNTNYFANHEFETNMTGLAFYVHNLNELFE